MKIEEAINIIELTTALTMQTAKITGNSEEITGSPYFEALETVIKYAKKHYAFEKTQNAMKQ